TTRRGRPTSRLPIARSRPRWRRRRPRARRTTSPRNASRSTAASATRGRTTRMCSCDAPRSTIHWWAHEVGSADASPTNTSPLFESVRGTCERTMKAAVDYETGAPEVLRYEDVPEPVAGPGTVLIEIGAISIEGGDTLNRAGGEMATNPHIVGYQSAGTIIEVGEGVTDRFVGQRVVATGLWGSHAAMIAAPSVITWVIP